MSLFLVLAAGLAMGVGSARASDESGDVAVKIEAPLDAAACTAVPATLTVLTLNVDVSHAAFESEDGVANSCTSLIPGSGVEIKLLDDSEPLEASEVEQEGEDEDKIQAPVQAVDPAAKTITLLGLTIDASNATIEGDDDNGDDEDGNQPIDLSQIIIGQFVEAELDPAQLPLLVATKIEVKNFANQVSVEVDDDSGSEIEDETEDITVSVDQAVMVRQARGAGRRPKMVKRTVHLQLQTKGSFVLTGLAKGPATIKVTRLVDGVKTAARRVVPVQPNKSRTVRMRLRKTRS